jgi:hypothetical protein
MIFRRRHHHNSLPTRESEELAKQRKAEELHVSSYFKSKTNIAREHVNLLGKLGEYPCRATVVKRICQKVFLLMIGLGFCWKEDYTPRMHIGLFVLLLWKYSSGS